MCFPGHAVNLQAGNAHLDCTGHQGAGVTPNGVAHERLEAWRCRLARRCHPTPWTLWSLLMKSCALCQINVRWRYILAQKQSQRANLCLLFISRQ